MKVLKKNMKKYLEQKTSVSSNAEKILKTILAAENAFYIAEEKRFLSKAEFLLVQSRFIQKRWWIIQGALLGMLGLLLHYSESSYYIQRGIGIAAPLFVILIFPELWKNKNCNAMEVECTTYYSLRQVYAARMVVFAIVDMLLLTLFFFVISFTEHFILTEMIVQFFIPFNVACCICFQTLYSKRAGSEILALLMCMVWIAVWVQIVLNEAIYSAISSPVWVLILAVSMMYVGYCIYHGQKKYLEMWEEVEVWS